MKKHVRDRWLINLSLLAGIAILSTILILGEKPEPVKSTLTKYVPQDISQITIARQGKKDIVFHKQRGLWKMVSPYAAHADETQIQALLDMAQLEVKNEVNGSDINPEKFGLQPAHTTVQFNQTKIQFGDVQPVGKQRYIQINDKVMLIDDRLATQLNTSSISMIDRQLIPRGSSIKSITISDKPSIVPGSEEDSQYIIMQWQTIKANWISLHPETEPAGIPVSITLNESDTPVEYLMQQREADFVLVRKDTLLEYHLALPAAKILGLADQDKTSGTALPTSPE